MTVFVVGSDHACSTCGKRRDERLVEGQDLEGTVCSREGYRDGFTVKEILADARDSKMEGFHRSGAETLSAVEGLDNLVDRAFHVESSLGFVVMLTLDNLFEAAHRLFTAHILARVAGEGLSDEHWLG